MALWLLLWQAASVAIHQELILVSPYRVLVRLTQLAITGDFWLSLGRSFLRIAGGFLLGAGGGILLGALSARFRKIAELLAPAMLAVRAVPVASFVILALILFSSKNLAVLISFLMVLPVFYFHVLEGLRSADRELAEMARVFRVSPVRKFRYVILPQMFPCLRSACALAAGMSWKSGVAAEVIGLPNGSIGEHLYNAKVYLETPDLLAWTLTIILISLGCERLLGLCLGRLQALTERM